MAKQTSRLVLLVCSRKKGNDNELLDGYGTCDPSLRKRNIPFLALHFLWAREQEGSFRINSNFVTDNNKTSFYSYALLYIQLDDRSMAFLQFLETISEVGGDQISEKDCDEWFWKCEDDNI